MSNCICPIGDLLKGGCPKQRGESLCWGESPKEQESQPETDFISLHPAEKRNFKLFALDTPAGSFEDWAEAYKAQVEFDLAKGDK